MIRSVLAAALKFRVLVMLAAITVVILGLLELRKAPVDVLPEYTLPYVEVQTESLGLSAAEVEQLLTVPLEQDLLNGVKGVEKIRSDSVPGLSSIVLTFERGTDIVRARQLVNERLSQPHAIPSVSKPPQMLQPVSSSNRVMMLALATDRLSAIELSVLARWTVRPRLLGIPGVANVAIWGHRDRQLQVQVDPRVLARKGVSLAQVIQTTGNAQLVSPLSFLDASTPGTGGFVDGPNQRLSVRHILPFGRPRDLAAVPLDETTRRLGDVAHVVEDHQPLIGDAVVPGTARGNGLMLVVEKLPGANTLEVTHRIDAAVAELRQGLGGVRIDTSVFRPATFIERSKAHVGAGLVIAGALMLLTLAAFLLRWRAVLVAAVAIPLSLLVAVAVLALTGTSINALVLVGLAAAIGVVVDDAVGDVHDIARRVEGRPWSGGTRAVAPAILAACLQRRRTMAFTTLILLLAAAPIFFLGGLDGAFVHPMALAYALTVVASMLVALTVTPALSLLALGLPERPPRTPALARRIGARYDAALGAAARHRRRALLGLAALLALAVGLVPVAGHALRPSFHDRQLLVHWNATPSTSLPEMDRITSRVVAELRRVPGVRDVGAHVGRAISADQAVGTGSGELWVTMEPKASYDRTLGDVRRVVGGYPGVRAAVRTFEDERTRGLFERSDTGVTVRVYGQQLGVLRAGAERLRGVVAGVAGVDHARVELAAAEPTLRIRVDIPRARRYGIKPGDVRRAVAILVSGLEVGSFFEQQKVFSVVVRGTPSTRASLDSIRALLLDTPAGGHVRLGTVADVRIGPTPVDIRHDAVSRYVDVRADVGGRDVGAVQHDIDRRLKHVALPLEYHAEVVGEAADRRAGGNLLIVALAAVIGTLLLLQAAFDSWRAAGVVLATLPAALAGGVLAAVAGDGDLSLGEIAGLFAVLAVGVRNAVALVTHAQRLAERDGLATGPPHVLGAARERLLPVLATAAVTAAAVLPFALMGRTAGNEITGPLAVVVLGGLLSATVLVLFITPVLPVHAGGAPAPEPITAARLPRTPAPVEVEP